MSNIVEVAEALAERLRTIDKLNAYAHVPGSAEWPGAFVQPPIIDYEGLDEGDLDMQFEVVVLVAAVGDINQLALMPYMALEGPQSVPAAILGDRTLGLGDVDAFVVRARPLGLQEQASYQGWGCVFEVMVRT